VKEGARENKKWELWMLRKNEGIRITSEEKEEGRRRE
jgi:hypothetical protein